MRPCLYCEVCDIVQVLRDEVVFLFSSEDIDLDVTDSATTSSLEHSVIAIGNNRSQSITIPREQFVCILCQENPCSSERPLVYTTYIQRSTLLSSNHSQSIEQGEDADPLVLYRDQRVGTYVGSCGHVMHGDCWQRYFESLLTNDRLSIRFRIRNTFDLTKREFLCPLCSGLGNTVLPIISDNVAGREDRCGDYFTGVIIRIRITSWTRREAYVEDPDQPSTCTAKL